MSSQKSWVSAIFYAFHNLPDFYKNKYYITDPVYTQEVFLFCIQIEIIPLQFRNVVLYCLLTECGRFPKRSLHRQCSPVRAEIGVAYM